MEKLKGALELLGFHNVWVSDGKIFRKLEGNDKPQLYYDYIILGFRRQVLS